MVQASAYESPVDMEIAPFLPQAHLHSIVGVWPPNVIPLYIWRTVQSYWWVVKFGSYGAPPLDAWLQSAYREMMMIEGEIAEARADMLAAKRQRG
jgi:hypothetical protein